MQLYKSMAHIGDGGHTHAPVHMAQTVHPTSGTCGFFKEDLKLDS